MQAAEAPPGLEPAIEWLPGEVVARVFCFVDAKTLMMTIPTVSDSNKGCPAGVEPNRPGSAPGVL